MIVQRLLILALFSALCSSAQEAPKTANAEAEIRALETLRLKSPTKPELWSGNIANDALFHLFDGTVARKQELLARMHREVMEDSLEMSDTMFSDIGDAAIFSYVFQRTHHGASGVYHQHIRRTLVYQRSGSSWQMISSAVAIVPFADLESRPVDPKVLDTYLGVWATTPPAAPTVTLTREGGKLMARGSDDTETTELLPLSDTTFVIRGDSNLITFEKSPDGKVSRMLSYDGGGSVQVYGRSIR
jgi:hypothetical protein